MTVTAPVTLDDLKAFLNFNSGDTGGDAILTQCLDAATSLVEQRVGPMVQRTLTKVAYPSDPWITLTGHVVSVTSVTDSNGNVMDSSTYIVDLDAGMLWIPVAFGWLFAYTVVYVAGIGETADDVPDGLKLATEIVAEQIWSTRRGPGPMVAPSASAGAPAVPRGFAWPARATELVAPWAQVVLA